jgi:hypothetical protein
MDEMSFDVVDDLNWLAVLLARAAYYLLAAPWFADPLFGPAWRQSIGWDKRAGERLGLGYYVGPLVTCLIAVIAVAMFVRGNGIALVRRGLVLGLVVAVGVACAGALRFGRARSTATKADRLVRDHGRIPPRRTHHGRSAHRLVVMAAAEPPRRPTQRRCAEIVTPSHSFV